MSEIEPRRDLVAMARENWEAHGWADAAPGMAATTSIMRAQQSLLARVDAQLRPLHLTFARYELLMLLKFSRDGVLPMRVIGERLQVHPTSVTSAVDRLEKDDLVARRQHPTDRRAILVEISDDGRKLAKRATKLVNDSVFVDLGLSTAATDELTGLLNELRRSEGDY